MKLIKLIAFVLVIAISFLVGCEQKDSQESTKEEVGASCEAKIGVGKGRFFISFASPCDFELGGGEVKVGVILNNQITWALGSNYPKIDAVSNGNLLKIKYQGLQFFPNIELLIEKRDNKLLLYGKLCNPYDYPIAVYGLELLAFAKKFNGYTTLGDDVLLLQNGYDSWSFAGVLKKQYGDKPLPVCNGTICDSGNNNSYKDVSGISFWNATIAKSAQGPALALGALTARHLKSYIAVEHNSHQGPDIRLILGATGDIVNLNADECYELDSVALISHYDPILASLEYGALVAEKNPMPNIPAKFENPMGWSSWYCLFSDVTESDVLEHAQILAQHGFAERGYKILQIDDGYEKAFGNWETNEKFPRGLTPLANDIKNWGLIAGIWLAPFGAFCDEEIVKQHPDWFVRKRDTGELYQYSDILQKPICALDVTHPEAKDWLYQTAVKFKQAGFEYFKLDFLYMGAVEGIRFQDITSLEAFEIGLKVIKEALQDDVFLLACGHPFLPTAGYFHAARTSSDIASPAWSWPNFRILLAVARNNAARFYSQMWQLVDPDNLLLRKPFNNFEQITSLADDALFGGVHILGDDLRKMDEQTKQLLFNPKVNELVRTKGLFIPVDLFYHPCKSLGRTTAEEMFFRKSDLPALWLKISENKKWLAVLNWWDEPVSYEISPSHVGAEGQAVLIDILTQQQLGLPTSIALQRHEGKIFEVKTNF